MFIDHLNLELGTCGHPDIVGLSCALLYFVLIVSLMFNQQGTYTMHPDMWQEVKRRGLLL